MQRQRRASGAGSTENRLWANPCDYASETTISKEKAADRAQKIIVQAISANESTANYSNTFAKQLHSYNTFESLIRDWSGDEWLQNFPWFRPQVLPKEKVLNSTMPDEYMNELMNSIDEVLPLMYKALKMIVASLYAFAKDGLNDNIVADNSLKSNLTESMHKVRLVLCYFTEYMKARELEIMPVYDSEVPDFTSNSVNKLSVGLLVYRDTLNYLEYLTQVFQKIYDTQYSK